MCGFQIKIHVNGCLLLVFRNIFGCKLNIFVANLTIEIRPCLWFGFEYTFCIRCLPFVRKIWSDFETKVWRQREKKSQTMRLILNKIRSAHSKCVMPYRTTFQQQILCYTVTRWNLTSPEICLKCGMWIHITVNLQMVNSVFRFFFLNSSWPFKKCFQQWFSVEYFAKTSNNLSVTL